VESGVPLRDSRKMLLQDTVQYRCEIQSTYLKMVQMFLSAICENRTWCGAGRIRFGKMDQALTFNRTASQILFPESIIDTAHTEMEKYKENVFRHIWLSSCDFVFM
jgi:hypothetical protein